jgi:hypothetical protein
MAIRAADAASVIGKIVPMSSGRRILNNARFHPQFPFSEHNWLGNLSPPKCRAIRSCRRPIQAPRELCSCVSVSAATFADAC